MSPHYNHCDEFARSRLMRRAVAEAGNGLPAIETGQPLPAGTGLSRRSFMLRSAGAMLSVYGASKLGLPGLEEGVAKAQGTSDPVLVSVFLDGGADSLSLLSPTTDSIYRSLRPNLALDPGAGTEFTEDPRLRWHPAAAAFDSLHRAGKLSVAPAIGYDSPNQSHFTSRHYWEVGALDPRETTGWMGRLLDRIGTSDNPLQGLSLSSALSPTLATATVPVAAIWGARYDLQQQGVSGEIANLMYQFASAIGDRGARGKDPAQATSGSVASQAIRLRSQLLPFEGADIAPSVSYPDNSYFPSALATVAAMLTSGMPLRCVALEAPGGYDTHDSQGVAFANNLQLAADSLGAFQADLEARGLADRVITLVWSEFGRRPEENGSAGTDHGAAGSAMLIGGRVRGQMVGEWPGLEQLDADENLRNTADFRALYSSLIEQWFGLDAADVIAGAATFPRYPLIR